MGMDSLFDRALTTARQLGASDIHLKPGMEPVLRIDGELRTLRNPDVPPLTRDFLHNLAMSLLNDRRRDILERLGDVTVALTSSSGTRQRVHISQHRGGMTISLHLVPPEAPALDKLGLPAGARDLVSPGAGLVLVAAGPGGGKTTTLAALIDDLTTRHPVRVVTLEDPVEIVLKDRRSVVVQREVGLDVPTIAAGLRAATRQDVDVLMVSEIGDREAGELALAAAEAGRLVLAGVSAASPAAAVTRMVGLWETEGRAAARARFAAALRGVLHQRLVAAKSGKGRTAQAEIVTGAAAAAEAVVRSS
jgi:twitching motility protein PilT